MIAPTFPNRILSGIGVPLLRAVLLVILTSLVLRYGFMQSDVLHGVCATTLEDWRCIVRFWAPQLFVDHRIGWLALAAGVLALLLHRRSVAALAVLAGAAGLVLYSADVSGVGLLLGLIVLSSPPSTAAQC